MIGPERFGDFVFLLEPVSQVNELATFGTEGSVVLLEPRAFVFAGRASDDQIGVHKSSNKLRLRDLFTARGEKI